MKRFMSEPNPQDRLSPLGAVLWADFRQLKEGESLLWVSADADGMDEVRDATNAPDLIVMQFVPPFPEDTSIIVGTASTIELVQQRLTDLGWKSFSSEEEAELRNHLDEHKSEYWDSLTAEQQDLRIADLGSWWQEETQRGEADKKYLASLTPDARDREEKRRDERLLAAMTSLEKETELKRRREIHFGTLRIPMGEKVTFSRTGAQYMVASGKGKPDNGGTVLSVPGEGLVSIRLLTRKLMGEDFVENGDVWALWEYRGEALRAIFERHLPGD